VSAIFCAADGSCRDRCYERLEHPRASRFTISQRLPGTGYLLAGLSSPNRVGILSFNRVNALTRSHTRERSSATCWHDVPDIDTVSVLGESFALIGHQCHRIIISVWHRQESREENRESTYEAAETETPKQERERSACTSHGDACAEKSNVTKSYLVYIIH